MRNWLTDFPTETGAAIPHTYTVAMNINNTDHFLLAKREDTRSQRASSLEMALILLGGMAVIGLSALLLL